MTAITPEAVAQMVADREAGTPGNFSVVQHRGYTTDYIVTDHPDFQQKPHGNYVGETGLAAGHARQRFEADARRFARTPDLEAAYLTLAAENATLRAERDAMAPTPDAELDAFVDFMCGAGEFDGAWFGDTHHSLSGHFWWRTRLRKTIATLRASEAAAVKAVTDALAYIDKGHNGMARNVLAKALTPTADKETK